MRRVGSPQTVGACGVVGSDCQVLASEKAAALTELGTLRQGWGTAIAFTDRFPVQTLRSRRREIAAMMSERSASRSLVVMSVPILSALLSSDWKRLRRPLPLLR